MQSKLKAWVGKSAEVLIDGPSPLDASCMRGRISQNYVLSLEKPEPALTLGALAHIDLIAMLLGRRAVIPSMPCGKQWAMDSMEPRHLRGLEVSDCL
jgi:hypothetical protein